MVDNYSPLFMFTIRGFRDFESIDLCAAHCRKFLTVASWYFLIWPEPNSVLSRQSSYFSNWLFLFCHTVTFYVCLPNRNFVASVFNETMSKNRNELPSFFAFIPNSQSCREPGGVHTKPVIISSIYLRLTSQIPLSNVFSWKTFCLFFNAPLPWNEINCSFDCIGEPPSESQLATTYTKICFSYVRILLYD